MSSLVNAIWADLMCQWCVVIVAIIQIDSRVVTNNMFEISCAGRTADQII